MGYHLCTRKLVYGMNFLNKIKILKFPKNGLDFVHYKLCRVENYFLIPNMEVDLNTKILR